MAPVTRSQTRLALSSNKVSNAVSNKVALFLEVTNNLLAYLDNPTTYQSKKVISMFDYIQTNYSNVIDVVISKLCNETNSREAKFFLQIEDNLRQIEHKCARF